MTIAELIEHLKKLPPNLPVGSFQTHDQGQEEDGYPWTFEEFTKGNFEVISVFPNNNLWDGQNKRGWFELDEHNDDLVYCIHSNEEKLPDGICPECQKLIRNVVVVREGY